MPGVKEKYPRENDTPLGACRASLPGKSVSWGRAFRQHIHVLDRVGSRNLPAPSHTTVRAVPHTAVHQ